MQTQPWCWSSEGRDCQSRELKESGVIGGWMWERRMTQVEAEEGSRPDHEALFKNPLF